MADLEDDPLAVLWGLTAPLWKPLRRWTRYGDISAAVREYRDRTGRDAETKAAFAESGSFESQVIRLFVAGNAAEIGELRRIATAAIGSCHANKYYLPADLVSDVVDALEGHTFLGDAPAGEPALEKLEGHWRQSKLATVAGAYLVPVKIASIEAVLGAYARSVGRSLPFAALGRFERCLARTLALADESEAGWLESELTGWLEEWVASETLRRRFREPATAAERIVEVLEGRRRPPGPTPPLRVRRLGQPVRLSTLDPTCRRDLIEAALAGVREVREAPSHSGAAPTTTPATRVSSGVPVPPTSTGGGTPDATRAEENAPVPGDTSQLAIVLSCPKCGGSFGVDDEVVTLECQYCGSLLALSAPDRDEMFLEEVRRPEPPDVLEPYIAARVALRRAELLDRYRDENGEVQAADLVIEMELKIFEKQLRSRLRVDELHRIHVPYWHLAGKVVQAAVGQWHNAAKTIRVRAFEAEHTVPAYDTSRANFRDHGLRLGRTRLRPLAVADARELAAFVPWHAVPQHSYREVQKWCGRTLEAEMDPICKHGEFLFGRRYLVYRRWWLARIEGEESQWVLVDGIYGNIGGRLEPAEVGEALSSLIADPLGSGETSFRTVHVIAPRCPDCGAELHPDSKLSFVVCANCHRGLEPRAEGIRLRSYHHASAEGVDGPIDYLPFWRYRFAIDVDGARIDTLDAWSAAAVPELPAGIARPTGESIWIPAVRLLGTHEGDLAWKSLVEWIHARPPRVLPEKIPLGTGGRPWGASLSERDARTLGRFVLAGVNGSAAAARFTSARFRRGVVAPRLELADPTLVMVPVAREEDGCALPGTGARLGRLLLEGGLRLEAMRASVYQIRS